MRTIGTYLARWLGQDDKSEADKMRLTGAYANISVMYGEAAPACPDDRINQYFRTHLRRQDVFILNGKLTLPALVRKLGAGFLSRRNKAV